jgi:hypothetical protein
LTRNPRTCLANGCAIPFAKRFVLAVGIGPRHQLRIYGTTEGASGRCGTYSLTRTVFSAFLARKVKRKWQVPRSRGCLVVS